MNANSSLEALINLGFDKNEATTALKSGKGLIHNAFFTLCGNPQEKYFILHYPNSDNKKVEQESQSKSYRQMGIPVGLLKFSSSTLWF